MKRTMTVLMLLMVLPLGAMAVTEDSASIQAGESEMSCPTGPECRPCPGPCPTPCGSVCTPSEASGIDAVVGSQAIVIG